MITRHEFNLVEGYSPRIGSRVKSDRFSTALDQADLMLDEEETITIRIGFITEDIEGNHVHEAALFRPKSKGGFTVTRFHRAMRRIYDELRDAKLVAGETVTIGGVTYPYGRRFFDIREDVLSHPWLESATKLRDGSWGVSLGS